MTTLSYNEAFDLDDLITLPLARAAGLAKVSARRLRYWDFKGLVRPAIKQRVSLRTTARLYAFDDLVGLLVVKHMLDEGFSLQHIRRVVDHLKSRGYDRPLDTLKFATAGNEIYFQHPDGTWEGDRAEDQIVIHQVINLAEIRTRVRRGVQRPESLYGAVEKRRGLLGGKLVFAGTRIPVDVVARRVAQGASDRDILGAYPDLTSEDIAAARANAASV